jgi:pullulanase/glycogen debranching enzyme
MAFEPFKTMSADYANLTLQPGPQPLGATLDGERYQLRRVLSGAVKVELCLFDATGEHEVARLALPRAPRTSGTDSCLRRSASPGSCTAYRPTGLSIPPTDCATTVQSC